MEFLKKITPENRIENVEAFTTKDYLFFRRKIDGIWNCISYECGAQLIHGNNNQPSDRKESDQEIIKLWWKNRLEVFKKGDVLEIRF